MKRLRKQAENNIKWVVAIEAEDGQHEKIFNTEDEARDYFKKQIGEHYTNVGKNSVVDKYGRRVSIYENEIGTCQVCGRKNVALTGTACDVMPGCVKVCSDCFDGYEVGLWDVKDGKIIKKTMRNLFKEDGIDFDFDDEEPEEDEE